jgi:phosphoglycerate dehydrogenase-like enzyme
VSAVEAAAALKVILLGPESAPFADLLRSGLRGKWELRVFAPTEPTADLAAELVSAEVLISCRYHRSFPPMPALRLLQVPATGINSISLAAVPATAAVCNAFGHQIAVAEYVILGMLACARDLLAVRQRFVLGKWHAGGGATDTPPTYGEVHGKTLCIVGLGRIGLEIAVRAKALGMRVIGCNRTLEGSRPCIDEVRPLAQIADLAARSDFLVLACALTEETRGIVDRQVLGVMPPTAFIINVGRGPLVAEEDLYVALQARRIAGAVLDVWYRYPDQSDPHPPPSKFPFGELDNVIMTPHVSGWTDGMLQRRWSEIAANLNSLALGKSLSNLIRPAVVAGDPR